MRKVAWPQVTFEPFKVATDDTSFVTLTLSFAQEHPTATSSEDTQLNSQGNACIQLIVSRAHMKRNWSGALIVRSLKVIREQRNMHDNVFHEALIAVEGIVRLGIETEGKEEGRSVEPCSSAGFRTIPFRA
jgi:hypothetical protein